MRRDKEGDYRVVYSTDQGSICAECGEAKARCGCAEKQRLAVKGDGKVRVRRETNGRSGKTVTTISGLALNQVQLTVLLKDLKRMCGAGGALKDGIIEVQGDHCDLVLRELGQRGFAAKRAGG